ncbi:MAG: YtxH domain-containing protein [Gemmatimonadota bacterium]
MAHEEDPQILGFVAGLICGAAIGAGVAILMAPDSGRKTRKRLQKAAVDLRETAADRWDDVAEDVKDRVEEVLDGARKRFS